MGVYQPKIEANVGTLLRSAYAFGAAFTFTVGRTGAWKQASNVTKSQRHIPHFEFVTFDDLRAHLPVGCQIVGVELDDHAVELPNLRHPLQACYLMGREDNGLPTAVREACHLLAEIPGARYCLNVAVAGSIVMYDRTQRLGAA